MNNFVAVAMFLCMGIFVKPLTPIVHVDHVIPVDTIQNQIHCMTENIYYEAKDESYEGQLAVATVVMNRVKSKEFPKSVCNVVYQRNPKGCQFSWVCQPHKITEPSLYEKAKKIAYDVLMKHARLPSVNRALFYHTKEVSPSWDLDMKLVDSIGAHLFYGPKSREGTSGD